MAIHIDFETYCDLDVRDVGAYRYADDPSIDILIACYAIDNGPVLRWLPHRDGWAMPRELRRALTQGQDVFAHNAQFERAVWQAVLHRRHGLPLPGLRQWRCTAALAAAAGLPRSLDGATKALKVGKELEKDKRGVALIRKFCGPRKPTKSDPRTRILPDDDPEEFEAFVQYCEQDVRAERNLLKRLPDLTSWEWENYWLDLLINENGLPLDTTLIEQAIKVTTHIEAKIQQRSQQITDGINPTQRDKMLEWLSVNGLDLLNLQADTVRQAAANKTLHLASAVRELLNLRIEASRVSTKKLQKMQEIACADGRAKGTLLYYGAHTGRASGALIQPQNYVRGYKSETEIDPVREALATGDADLFCLLFDPHPMYTLSQCIRSFIAAPAGYEMLVVDYAQIEARDLDWHSRNESGLKGWRSGIDPYRQLASLMYGIPVEEVSGEQRRIGKNARLGAGYSMNAKTFLEYCHKQGLTSVDADTAELAIGTFRESNPAIPKYWKAVENYAIAAIQAPGIPLKLGHCMFQKRDHWLTITLPSGRALYYPYAKVESVETKWGTRQQIRYLSNRGVPNHTYGAKLVENIIQGDCRDILMTGLHNAMRAQYVPIGHAHDEGIFLRPQGAGDLEELVQLMCDMPAYRSGCPIDAEGYIGRYYRKN